MNDKRGNKGLIALIITALVATFGVGIIFLAIGGNYVLRNLPRQNNPQLEQGNRAPRPQQIAVEPGNNRASPAASVAQTALAGVVGISVLRVDSNSIFDGKTNEKWGVGSGVIVSTNGYILTNHHVAGGRNRRIIVSLANGKNVDGTTVWSDPVLDLAVVKVNVSGLTAIPLGDANALRVGEPAIAIGNPLGLQFQRTVTSGIISALNRTIRIDTDQGSNYMEDLIQTDASINPGNSGGPLLNSAGQVVGINTIKVASAEALGFAIPINVAVPIINKYVNDGDFKETYMGVFAYDREVIPYLDGNIKVDNGIYVANVDNDGPAYKSGIKLGCIITEVDGIKMNTMLQLRTYIYSRNPGDTIRVTHVDKGKERTVSIKLAQKTRDGLVTR